MPQKTSLLALIAVVALLGAGCGKKPLATGDTPEFIPRQNVNAPRDAWGEYQRAKAASDVIPKDTKDEKQAEPYIALSVPSGWSGDQGIWRPSADDKLNYVRAAYFPNIGPETEWSNEQTLPEYDVVHAEKTDAEYVLMMNHRGLKTSVLKVMTPDPKSPGDGFYFIECHVAYDAKDRDALWNACKASVESATYH
jgi:hypothetical protein